MVQEGIAHRVDPLAEIVIDRDVTRFSLSMEIGLPYGLLCAPSDEVRTLVATLAIDQS